MSEDQDGIKELLPVFKYHQRDYFRNKSQCHQHHNKKFVTKESAETIAEHIDIQKLVLIMQETANVTGRKSLHTNTKSQKVVTKNILENEVK